MSQSRESSRNDLAAAAELADSYQSMRQEIGKVVIGQAEVVEELLIGLFARGHVLLVGVPGLAKTLLVITVARILSLSFRRIQFTPDMMPSDITGTDILQDDPETGRRQFTFIPGPLFANIILADEINRTPPKTQAALLEAMQERHVTAGGAHLSSTRPVLRSGDAEPDRAGGDVPLARGAARPVHAQSCWCRTRPPSEELEILRRTTGEATETPEVTLSAEQIVELQTPGAAGPGGRACFRYARDLVRASRPGQDEATDSVRKCVLGRRPVPASL